jgi:hypothetical protein
MMSLLDSLRKPYNAVFKPKYSGGDADSGGMDESFNQAHEQAQANLQKSPEQLQSELSKGMESSGPIVNPEEIQSKSSVLGMTTPEDYSQVLSKIAQQKHQDTINSLNVQNKYRAQEMSDKNVKTAFENSINRNEFKKQAHMRRMERQQARYAARMAAIGSVFKLAGTAIGGAIGGGDGAKVGYRAGTGAGPQSTNIYFTGGK